MKEQHALELELANKKAAFVGSSAMDDEQAAELEREIGNLSDLIGGLQDGAFPCSKTVGSLTCISSHAELHRAQDEKKKLHMQLSSTALEREAAERELHNWRTKLSEADTGGAPLSVRLGPTLKSVFTLQQMRLLQHS